MFFTCFLRTVVVKKDVLETGFKTVYKNCIPKNKSIRVSTSRSNNLDLLCNHETHMQHVPTLVEFIFASNNLHPSLSNTYKKANLPYLEYVFINLITLIVYRHTSLTDLLTNSRRSISDYPATVKGRIVKFTTYYHLYQYQLFGC